MGGTIIGIASALIGIPIALLFVIGLTFGSVPTFIQQVLAVPLILGAVGMGVGIAAAKGT